MDFGAYLRKHRETAEMSLRQLAKRLDISPSVISRIENGAAAPLGGEHFEALHEALPTVRTAQLALMRLHHLDPLATEHLMAALEYPNPKGWSEDNGG